MRIHLSVKDLDAFIEGNVSAREREKIKLHLNECSICRAKYGILLDTENYLAEEDYIDDMFTERVMNSLKKGEYKSAGNKTLIKRRSILKPVLSLILVCAFVGTAFYFGTKYDSIKRNTATQPDRSQETQITKTPADTPVPTVRIETVNLTLYFPNQSAEFVVPVQRRVEIKNGEKIEEVVFRELQKGPEGDGRNTVIPEGTKLLSSEVRDGVCYLNLSKEFVENNPGGSAFENVLINSVVNSLTELPEIKKVQFLIEGEKREVYSHMVFDEPFERNESIIRTAENTPEAIERSIRELGFKVLTAFRDKDMQTLSQYVHPDKGVRFSPYTYVELERDVVISKEEIKTLLESDKVYTWGLYDGSGEPIELTFSEYLSRFVYDRDFINADEIIYDVRYDRGNTINNVFEVYKGSHVIEYYFSGNEEYGGMDWKSLKLVFEEKEGKWYLVGVVHDEWTI